METVDICCCTIFFNPPENDNPCLLPSYRSVGHFSSMTQLMVITRSFDVALNGRGYTALPKVNEKWRAAMTAALEEEKKKLWKNVLCNHLSNALHKKTRTLLRAIVVVARARAAALVHGLGFSLQRKLPTNDVNI